MVSEYMEKIGLGKAGTDCHDYISNAPAQVARLNELLLKICEGEESINCLEVGFNCGHSSELMLQASRHTRVVSFDLPNNFYLPVFEGKKYIDSVFPGRHTLMLGDSKASIPYYFQQNPQARFDFMFIDGGHEYIVALCDLVNCSKLAHSETLVCFDDVLEDGVDHPERVADWIRGPSKAWDLMCKSGYIREAGREVYHKGVRGMVWGYYLCRTEMKLELTGEREVRFKIVKLGEVEEPKA